MNEFKEMIYQKEQKRELLGYGTYKGYKFYILSLGTHPVAYVEIPKTHPLYDRHFIDWDYYDNIGVHGGITYTENHLYLPNGMLKGWFIGWDYNHCNDYNELLRNHFKLFDSDNFNKKWTTKEVYEDVKSVINQLL